MKICKKHLSFSFFGLLLALPFLLSPSTSHAEWTLNDDNPGQVLYFSDQGVSATFEYFPNSWAFSPDGGSYSYDQQSIDDAYLLDPSPLPENVNGAAEGFDWPCDWSQYSPACPPPVTPTSTIAWFCDYSDPVELGSGSSTSHAFSRETCYYASSTEDVSLSLISDIRSQAGGINFGLAIIITIVFVFLLYLLWSQFGNKKPWQK